MPFVLSGIVAACGGGGSSPTGATPQPGPPADPQIRSVSVKPTSASAASGATIRLTATPRDAEGKVVMGESAHWESDDENVTIAAVPGRPYQADVSSPVGTTATVRVTFMTDDGPVTGSGTVSFATVTVATISIIPTTTTLETGRWIRLTATARKENGAIATGAVVTWSSSHPEVTVTPYPPNPNQADVRSMVPAEAIITASHGSASGQSDVRFHGSATCPPIDHVQIAGSNFLIGVGETSELQAILKDAAGRTLPTSGCTISWSSTAQVTLSMDLQNPFLATATGVSLGIATITAIVQGTPHSTTIEVR